MRDVAELLLDAMRFLDFLFPLEVSYRWHFSIYKQQKHRMEGSAGSELMFVSCCGSSSHGKLPKSCVGVFSQVLV